METVTLCSPTARPTVLISNGEIQSTNNCPSKLHDCVAILLLVSQVSAVPVTLHTTEIRGGVVKDVASMSVVPPASVAMIRRVWLPGTKSNEFT